MSGMMGRTRSTVVCDPRASVGSEHDARAKPIWPTISRVRPPRASANETLRARFVEFRLGFVSDEAAHTFGRAYWHHYRHAGGDYGPRWAQVQMRFACIDEEDVIHQIQRTLCQISWMVPEEARPALGELIINRDAGRIPSNRQRNARQERDAVCGIRLEVPTVPGSMTVRRADSRPPPSPAGLPQDSDDIARSNPIPLWPLRTAPTPPRSMELGRSLESRHVDITAVFHTELASRSFSKRLWKLFPVPRCSP